MLSRWDEFAALIIDGRTITYGELAVAVEQCAARLAADGLSGSRVAVVDVGSLVSIATMFGAARIGAAAALMNPALTPPELKALVKDSGCTDVGVAERLPGLRERDGLEKPDRARLKSAS